MCIFIFQSERDLHETLTYYTKPEDLEAIKKIQVYLNYYLTYDKLIRALCANDGHNAFKLNITLQAGGKTYSKDDPRISEAIRSLDRFDGFELDVRYSGQTGDIGGDLEDTEIIFPDYLNNNKGMYEYLSNSTDRDIEYRMMAYHPNSDQFAVAYINNDVCTDNFYDLIEHIADATCDNEVYATNDFYLTAAFDFNKYAAQAPCTTWTISSPRGSTCTRTAICTYRRLN